LLYESSVGVRKALRDVVRIDSGYPILVIVPGLRGPVLVNPVTSLLWQVFVRTSKYSIYPYRNSGLQTIN
jgi:hypothetical protein